MSMTLIALVVVALQLPPQTATKLLSASMKADVDQLVRAAEELTEVWPSQPPPPIPEVALVARHGKPVVPLLTALLSDDPNAEGDRRRWRVQQQVALALCRIYSEPAGCGRAYCDGDPPERIGHMKQGWLAKIAADAEMQASSAKKLLDRFKQEKVFWPQFEIGQALAATGDRDVVRELEAWLTLDDRHLRGNVAFVLGRLGDPRGFETVAQMLADRSRRSAGQGIPGGNWTVQAQIEADRYYAAHLLGDLKDLRGVPLLIPLLNDGDVKNIVPWSLGEIGDRRAVGPLLQVLEKDDPSMRVLAIYALEKLNAHDALPKLRELLEDKRKSNFGGLTTVAQAARRAIATISQLP
jgi:HEAT repeat protein